MTTLPLPDKCPGGLTPSECACCNQGAERTAQRQFEIDQLRPAWRIAWMVARRRLEHPEPNDLLNPVPNIIEAIEALADELFHLTGANHDE